MEAFTSPYEADAYLVFLESQLSPKFPRTFVYATDADLIAIGVQRMVWDIQKVARGELQGQVISRAALLRPDLRLMRDARGGSFLRLLRGVPSGCEDIVTQEPHVIDRRILAFACFAGND